MSFEQDAGYPRSVVGHYIAWTPVIAGALVATALSTILLAFGAAVGLGVASTAPTWRDASVALWLLSGLYLILVALISFGVGGYIAGHIRVAGPSADPADVEHRDGAHGLCAWAVAVVLGAIIAALLGVALTRAPAAQGTSLSSAGAAEPLLSYELDRMFRPARRAPNAESPMERAEAGRILLTASGHDGVATEDRAYLVQLVGGVTGLAGADAERTCASSLVHREHQTGLSGKARFRPVRDACSTRGLVVLRVGDGPRCASGAPGRAQRDADRNCVNHSFADRSPVSSRYSHPFASVHSRFTVAGEMPSAAAVSSTVSPPKKRISTMRA